MVANYISDQQPSIANTSLSTADTMLLRSLKKGTRLSVSNEAEANTKDCFDLFSRSLTYVLSRVLGLTSESCLFC